jgi:cytochrome c1
MKARFAGVAILLVVSLLPLCAAVLPGTAAAIALHIADDGPKDAVLQGQIAFHTDAEDVVAGKRLYPRNCAGCHGANGAGDGPCMDGRGSHLVSLGPLAGMLDPSPTDLRSNRYRYGSDASHVFTTVWLGAKHWSKCPPTSAMAGFRGRLSKGKVLQILAYVQHDFRRRN